MLPIGRTSDFESEVKIEEGSQFRIGSQNLRRARNLPLGQVL